MPRRKLDADGEALFAAVIPVLLAGALPAGTRKRGRPRSRIRSPASTRPSPGCPPAAQHELAQLFALLALPPVRWSFARVGAPWRDAPEAEVRRFLDRCRDSSFALLRTAYDALHQLTFAAWYGNPRAWPGIGYDGPPALG